MTLMGNDVLYKTGALILGLTQDMMLHAEKQQWADFEAKANQRQSMYKKYLQIQSQQSHDDETEDMCSCESLFDYVMSLNNLLLENDTIKQRFATANISVQALIELSAE